MKKAYLYKKDDGDIYYSYYPSDEGIKNGSYVEIPMNVFYSAFYEGGPKFSSLYNKYKHNP
jgi:hypothetical protein